VAATPHRADRVASGSSDTLSQMPLGPLGVTAILAALDWGAWDWATNSNHTTVSLIAGLLLAPIAVAFAWSLLRVVAALARIGVRRLGAQHSVTAVGPPTATVPASAAPFDIEAEGDRVAA
jgi:hypothetical protein